MDDASCSESCMLFFLVLLKLRLQSPVVRRRWHWFINVLFYDIYFLCE
jgi:hypothetical protein